MRVGRTDIPLGRLVEGHVDALRILAQAGSDPRPGVRYGVWASRSAGTGVAAVSDGEEVRLDETIRFAPGAGVLDRALVPVWLDQQTHLLVDLDVAGLPVDRTDWQTSAMRVSQTHTVRVESVTVPYRDVVGGPGFYLGRPGLPPGGVGVAAVWAGGLARVLDVCVTMLTDRPVSPVQEARLGRAQLHLVAALTSVRAAGHWLDKLLGGERPDSTLPSALATGCGEARAVVADAVVSALAEVRALAGPVGLAFDPDLGHALDDLGLYVAQLNLDAEAARLGAALRGAHLREALDVVVVVPAHDERSPSHGLDSAGAGDQPRRRPRRTSSTTSTIAAAAMPASAAGGSCLARSRAS